MESQEADVLDSTVERQEDERIENESDGLEPSESTENPTTTTATVSSETENTQPADDLKDDYDDSDDEKAAEWDDEFIEWNDEFFDDKIDNDDVFGECVDEDGSQAKSKEDKKEQASAIQEAVSEAPESCDDPAKLEKSPPDSISEEPELELGSQSKQYKNTETLPQTEPRSDHEQLDSSTEQKSPHKRKRLEGEDVLPSMKEFAQSLAVVLQQELLRVGAPFSTNQITAFPSVPLTEMDKAHNRTFTTRQRTKDEPESQRNRGASNIYLTGGETGPIQSIGQVPEKLLLEKPWWALLKKKDETLSASSKEETTVPLDPVVDASVCSKQPLIILPLKKRPKVTAPVLADQENVPVDSVGEMSEKSEKPSLGQPESSVLTEGNTAQGEPADELGTVTDVLAATVNPVLIEENTQLEPVDDVLEKVPDILAAPVDMVLTEENTAQVKPTDDALETVPDILAAPVDPVLTEENTAQVEPFNDALETAVPDILVAPVDPVSIEENSAQVESADDTLGTVPDILAAPVNQEEEYKNIQLPIQSAGDPLQQTSQKLGNQESLDLLPTAIESVPSEETAPVESDSKVSEEVTQIPSGLPTTNDDSNIPSIRDEETAQEVGSVKEFEECEKVPPVSEETVPIESSSEVSEEIEQIPPVLPIIKDDTNLPSIREDEETEQETQSEEASEVREKAPPVSPRTKLLPTNSPTQSKSETAQVDADCTALGGVAREIEIKEDTKLTKKKKNLNLATETPPVPQKLTVPEPALQEHKKTAVAIEEAVNLVRHEPPLAPKSMDQSQVLEIPWENPASLTSFPSVPSTPKDMYYNSYLYWQKKKTEKRAQKPVKGTRRLPSASLKIRERISSAQAPTATKKVEPLSDPPKELAQEPSVSLSAKHPECSLPATSENTVHTLPVPSELASEPAKPQLIAQESQNVASDLTSPPADEWQNFKISGEGLADDVTKVQSDEATSSRPVPHVSLGGEPEDSSFKQSTLLSPSATDIGDSDPFTTDTHDLYELTLLERKIKRFRAYKGNLPEENHIRDLIGVQVYQWPCHEQQPCRQFCSRCKFCCHQFYCTCQPLSLRGRQWCLHIHAAIHPDRCERENVTFVMDAWQMSRPELAHLRATCYDLENVTSENGVFLVMEFGNLPARVTPGNWQQRCRVCEPAKSCSTCDICVHTYTCLCYAFRQGELCEHCHVVAIHLKKLREFYLSLKGGSSTQTSGSSGIPQLASNSGGTSAAASGLDGASKVAADSESYPGYWV